MSFTPLPKTFTDTCLERDPSFPQILELGCGDGRFREVLADHGLAAWGLDLGGPDQGTVADVVGDALAPPVVLGSVDILLAPNLLRHLVVSQPGWDFLARWLELLKPGGSLFIFEDEPGQVPSAVAHYRDLQDFLGRLLPETRGPLLCLADFKDRVASLGIVACWEFGLARNRYPVDAAAVLDFLGRGEDPTTEPGRLQEGITRDGLDPGYFWWARAGTASEGTVT